MLYVLIFGKFLDPPLGKDEFSLEKLNYTQDCTVSSMYFQNFLGRGSPDPSPIQSRVSLSIRASTSNLGRFAPSFWASPSIHPNMFDHFPKQGELDKIFHPSTPPPSWLRHCVYNSIYRLSYIAGRPGWPEPPQYFRQVGAYAWSPWILRFKLTLILFALNPCIKSYIFPGICRMHEQVCRFYQLSKKFLN